MDSYAILKTIYKVIFGGSNKQIVCVKIGEIFAIFNYSLYLCTMKTRCENCVNIAIRKRYKGTR